MVRERVRSSSGHASRVGVEQIARVLADPQTSIPGLLCGTMTLLIEEIRLLEARISQLERELAAAARQLPNVRHERRP